MKNQPIKLSDELLAKLEISNLISEPKQATGKEPTWFKTDKVGKSDWWCEGQSGFVCNFWFVIKGDFPKGNIEIKPDYTAQTDRFFSETRPQIIPVLLPHKNPKYVTASNGQHFRAKAVKTVWARYPDAVFYVNPPSRHGFPCNFIEARRQNGDEIVALIMSTLIPSEKNQ